MNTTKKTQQPTPAPWLLTQESANRYLITNPKTQKLIAACGSYGIKPNELDRANARLISKAPELLANCIETIKGSDKLASDHPHIWEMMTLEQKTDYAAFKQLIADLTGDEAELNQESAKPRTYRKLDYGETIQKGDEYGIGDYWEPAQMAGMTVEKNQTYRRKVSDDQPKPA